MITTTSRHKVENLRFEGDEMLLTIDGQPLRFALEHISTRLLKASLPERIRFIVSASGYGIHWPDVDEDLSVEGLLKSAESDR
jgi:hypothetical protein